MQWCVCVCVLASQKQNEAFADVFVIVHIKVTTNVPFWYDDDDVH